MSEKQLRHFRLYKPHGYISQFVSSHRKKKLLGELHTFPEGVNPIGRLDEDSEGLLLLSNDGQLHNYLLGQAVEKEYQVQLHGILTDEALRTLREGVRIHLRGLPHDTKPALVTRLEVAPVYTGHTPHILLHKQIDTTWISITLQEGKNRQIRRMTAAVGYPTLRLVRVRIGPVTLEGMLPGDVVEMDNPWEVHIGRG